MITICPVLICLLDVLHKQYRLMNFAARDVAMTYPFHCVQQQYIPVHVCPNSVSSPSPVRITDIIYLMFARDQKIANLVNSNV